MNKICLKIEYSPEHINSDNLVKIIKCIAGVAIVQEIKKEK